MSEHIARIKPKKSSVAGEVPLVTDLEVAELAVNTADGKLFVKHTDNSIKEISGGSGSGGGVVLPAVNGWTISSDSIGSTAQVLDAPAHSSGDLLIACIMTRDSGGALTPPSGWALHGEYLSSLAFDGDTQKISVFTKAATGSEPATYTWSQVSSGRICGWVASVGGNAVIDSVLESYSNGTTATIIALENTLNLTAATWVYSSDTSEAYSQTGPGVSEITDSPTIRARISGGYTTETGVVTSTHAATSTDNSPNHGMIRIALSTFTSISDSADVDTVSNPPTDGQVLTWIDANSKWEPADASGGGGGGATSLDELSDVSYQNGSLAPTALDQIVFSSPDVPANDTQKIFSNPTYGFGLGSYLASDSAQGSLFYLHGTKGAEFKIGGDSILRLGGETGVTDSSPELRFTNGNETTDTPTGYHVGFKLDGVNLTSSTTYTLPLVDGSSGQVLTTDGAGVMSWTTSTSGISDAPADGQQYARQNNTWTVVQASGDGGGAYGSHASETQTAANGAANYTALGQAGILHKVTSSLDAWIVIYGSDADRTADAGRAYGVDPAPGSGVLAEFYITAGSTILATPGTNYFNNDDPIEETIYLAVRDQAGSDVNSEVTVSAFAQKQITRITGGTF